MLGAESASKSHEMNDQEYSEFKQMVAKVLNLDLEAYHGEYVRRRLEIFVNRYRSKDGSIPFDVMGKDPDLAPKLIDALAVNVSGFFRDAKQYEYLRSTLLPEMTKGGRQLKIWSAACSSGQEPYSLAMLLDELPNPTNHRIMATDLDAKDVKRASEGGPYSESEIKDLPAWRRKKYFIASGGRYKVSPPLPKRIKFLVHNLLADPFEADFDLIVCRNVMLYFGKEAKANLIRRFHKALKPGGVLFIGGTEAFLGDDRDGFEKLDSDFHRKLAPSGSEARPKVA